MATNNFDSVSKDNTDAVFNVIQSNLTLQKQVH